MSDAWAKFWLAMAIMAAAAALGGLTYWRPPWGSLAEWAAAFGTTAGVAAAVWLAAKEARDRREDARAETRRLLMIAVHEGLAVAAMIMVVRQQYRLEAEEPHDKLPESTLTQAVDFLDRFPIYSLPAAAVHYVRLMQSMATTIVQIGKAMPPAVIRAARAKQGDQDWLGFLEYLDEREAEFNRKLEGLTGVAIEYGATVVKELEDA